MRSLLYIYSRRWPCHSDRSNARGDSHTARCSRHHRNPDHILDKKDGEEKQKTAFITKQLQNILTWNIKTKQKQEIGHCGGRQFNTGLGLCLPNNNYHNMLSKHLSKQYQYHSTAAKPFNTRARTHPHKHTHTHNVTSLVQTWCSWLLIALFPTRHDCAFSLLLASIFKILQWVQFIPPRILSSSDFFFSAINHEYLCENLVFKSTWCPSEPFPK